MRQCFFCRKTSGLERHHIFGGALRKKSEKYGLVVDLCHECHNEPPNGVHFNPAQMNKLHRYGQAKWMDEHNATIEDFRKEFYKNYLDEFNDICYEDIEADCLGKKEKSC